MELEKQDVEAEDIQMPNVKRTLVNPDHCVLGAKGHLSFSPEAWEGQVSGYPSLRAWQSSEGAGISAHYLLIST